MNIFDNHTTSSPRETVALGETLARQLAPGNVIALYGELGAGKTCFSQGVAKALGITQAVTSPTFTVINEYPAACPLYHIDLYRLQGPDDALAIGIEDYLDSDGITLIEWAERCVDILPETCIHVRLRHSDTPDERLISIEKKA